MLALALALALAGTPTQPTWDAIPTDKPVMLRVESAVVSVKDENPTGSKVYDAGLGYYLNDLAYDRIAEELARLQLVNTDLAAERDVLKAHVKADIADRPSVVTWVAVGIIVLAGVGVGFVIGSGR